MLIGSQPSAERLWSLRFSVSLAPLELKVKSVVSFPVGVTDSEGALGATEIFASFVKSTISCTFSRVKQTYFYSHIGERLKLLQLLFGSDGRILPGNNSK